MGNDFKNGMRGTGFSSQSLITGQYSSLINRKDHTYVCPNGHRTIVPFAEGAEAPATWVCKCGLEADLESRGRKRREQATMSPADLPMADQPWLTHWGAVMERRSEEELKEILDKRLKMHREGWIPDYE